MQVDAPNAKMVESPPSPEGTLPASVSLRLIELCNRPAKDRDLAQAALLMRDWCGVAIASAGEMSAKQIQKSIRQSDGASYAIGLGLLTAEAAAFANGSLGTLLEMDDLHRASVMHAGDVVIPAALAAAQEHGVSGHVLLEAILQGYEVALRLGEVAAAQGYTAWYNSATCGVFGAAFAAAHASGASDRQKADVLGQAGMQAAGVWQCRLETTDSKAVATASAARAGVTSAQLGMNGVRGAHEIFEGRLGFFATYYPDANADDVLLRPERNWLVHEVSFKPWPACRHVHPAIGLALALRKQIDVDQISLIQVSTYAAAVEFCDIPAPKTAHEARFSLQHCVAVALMNGDVQMADAAPQILTDHAIATLRTKVEVLADAEFTAAFPNQMGAHMVISYAQDGVAQARCDAAKGDPEDPMTDSDLVAKFHKNCHNAGMSEADISMVQSALNNLEAAQTLDGLSAALAVVARPETDAYHKGDFND